MRFLTFPPSRVRLAEQDGARGGQSGTDSMQMVMHDAREPLHVSTIVHRYMTTIDTPRIQKNLAKPISWLECQLEVMGNFGQTC